MTKKSLSLIDLPQTEIWSIQANRLNSISEISQTICGQIVGQGEMAAFSQSRILHLWPHKLLLLTAKVDSEVVTDLKKNLTDVTHGYSYLQIEGDSAFEFFNAHVPVDLDNDVFQSRRVAKTQLQDYSVIFWWTNSDSVQLLIDRSYTESFREYFKSAVNLWREL